MITCIVCRNREAEGELFCSECGARLSASWANAGPMATASFPASAVRLREMAAAPATSPPEQRPGQITLAISGIAKPVILEGRSEYILGREGQEQVVPDLNLNDYGARDKGVSRVHAALRQDKDRLLLVDLGSTNGTRLNGQQLAAHQPTPVADGDEIRLGKLLLKISFML